MTDFRIGYLYSLAPIHCGGEGDLGNILDIAREAHTNFPYVPGSSLRGSLRDEVKQYGGEKITDTLFGKELGNGTQMGVHQVWFGDARLLWVPMRTMAMQGTDVFTWVSCPSLIRDHALVARKSAALFPDHPVGDRPGTYLIADAEIKVSALTEEQKSTIALAGNWHDDLKTAVQPTWERSRIILPDANFQILMEHSLWTQVRNKIQAESNGVNQAGSAEVFWTDICIPRDTILYYPWGYSLLPEKSVTSQEHEMMIAVLQGLLQVGGQANVGRGWVQSWVNNSAVPSTHSTKTSLALGV